MKKAKEIYAEDLMRIEEGDSLECRIYDYQPMLEEFGEIILQENDDSYQGDSFLIYKDGERYGYLNFGWGSCSGCDALQACGTIEEVQELMDELCNRIIWCENIDAFEQWFKSRDWQGNYCWWSGSAFHEFYKKVLKWFDNIKK
jgi:hypothetical protein